VSFRQKPHSDGNGSSFERHMVQGAAPKAPHPGQIGGKIRSSALFQRSFQKIWFCTLVLPFDEPIAAR